MLEGTEDMTNLSYLNEVSLAVELSQSPNAEYPSSTRLQQLRQACCILFEHVIRAIPRSTPTLVSFWSQSIPSPLSRCIRPTWFKRMLASGKAMCVSTRPALIYLSTYQQCILFGYIQLEPHLFAIAEDAYRCMVRDKRNQTIIVSGER